MLKKIISSLIFLLCLTIFLFYKEIFFTISKVSNLENFFIYFVREKIFFFWLILTTAVFIIIYINLNFKKNKLNLLSKYYLIFDNNKYLKYIFLIILILIILFNNLNNSNFWFDETIQISISKGLYFLSTPFTPDGKIEDVWFYNNYFNMDPGGFSYLLYFWMKISTTPAFIRFLPFLFLIFSLIFIYFIIKNFVQSKSLSLIFPFFFISSPLVSSYSFELRAYSFEFFSAIFCLFVVLNYENILKSFKLSLIIGITLAICLTSRYSVVFLIFTTFLTIFLFIIKTKNYKELINIIIISIPTIIISLLLYNFILKIQNPSGTSPPYVAHLYFSKSSIYEIFFKPRVISVLLPIFLLSFYKIFFKPKEVFLTRYLVFSYLLLFLLIIFSFLEKYPLAFITRWDMGIHSILWFGWIYILIIVTKKFTNNYRNLLKLSWIFLYFKSVLVIIIFYASYIPNENIYSNLKVCASNIKNSKIIVNEASMASIKYLFEFGPLKHYSGTYKNIIFYSENLNLDNKIIRKLDLDNKIIRKNVVKEKNLNINNFNYFLFSHFKKNYIYKKISNSEKFYRCPVNGNTEFYIRK